MVNLSILYMKSKNLIRLSKTNLLSSNANTCKNRTKKNIQIHNLAIEHDHTQDCEEHMILVIKYELTRYFKKVMFLIVHRK